MLSILFAILLRPSVMIFLGVIVVAAVALVYFKGPKAVLKWALDGRVWLAIAGFVVFLSFGDLKKENAELRERVDLQEQVITSKEDATQTIIVREAARQQRAGESTTIRDATTSHQAQPEEVIDATLDAIAQVQDGGLDGRSPARPVEPQPDGVRKHPDGSVAP